MRSGIKRKLSSDRLCESFAGICESFPGAFGEVLPEITPQHSVFYCTPKRRYHSRSYCIKRSGENFTIPAIYVGRLTVKGYACRVFS